MADVVEAMKTEKKSGTSLPIDGCVVILSMEITPKKIKISLLMQSKPTNTQTEGLILLNKIIPKKMGTMNPLVIVT